MELPFRVLAEEAFANDPFNASLSFTDEKKIHHNL